MGTTREGSSRNNLYKGCVVELRYAGYGCRVSAGGEVRAVVASSQRAPAAVDGGGGGRGVGPGWGVGGGASVGAVPADGVQGTGRAGRTGAGRRVGGVDRSGQSR